MILVPTVKDAKFYFEALVCKETLIVLGVCLFLAFLASPRSIIIDAGRYRITAFLPLLMLVFAILLPACVTPPVIKYEFAGLICLAFAFGFSLSNLRIKSNYSRAIGIFFGLLCVVLISLYVRGLLLSTINDPTF